MQSSAAEETRHQACAAAAGPQNKQSIRGAPSRLQRLMNWAHQGHRITDLGLPSRLVTSMIRAGHSRKFHLRFENRSDCDPFLSLALSKWTFEEARLGLSPLRLSHGHQGGTQGKPADLQRLRSGG